MTTSPQPLRRKLRYESLQDLQDDVDFLARSEIVTVGNWTFAQILTHLTRVMNASLDGIDYQAPWPVRKIASLMKNRMLRKGIRPGYKIPSSIKSFLPEENRELEPSLQEMRLAIARFETETPDQHHPFLGKLTREEWCLLHLRHAELHLGFVVPAAPHDSNE